MWLCARAAMFICKAEWPLGRSPIPLVWSCVQSASVANTFLSEVAIPLWRRAADDVLARERVLRRLLDSDKEVWAHAERLIVH